MLSSQAGMQDACIVLEDADLKLAASNIVKGGFSYSGQRCTAVKVVLAIESIADELVAAVAKGVDGLSVGKPEARLLLILVLWCSLLCPAGCAGHWAQTACSLAVGCLGLLESL